MQVDLYNGRKMVVEVVVFFQKKNLRSSLVWQQEHLAHQ